MQYFMGIVPPDDYQQQIIAFQKRWSSNTLPQVVEPHITVKAQGGLATDLAWLGRVKEMCSEFPSFYLPIRGPGSFGNSVLYLSIESEGIFELHKRLVRVISPTTESIQSYFELERYTPHLTLGQTYWGMSEVELDELRSEVRKSLYPYPSFAVEHIRIYREVEEDSYEPFQDVPLVCIK